MGKEESSLTGIKTNLILDLIAQARMAISPNVKARKEKVKQLFKWAEGIKLVSASEGNKWRICEALAIAVDRTQASLWAQGSAEAEGGLEQSTENETASKSGI